MSEKDQQLSPEEKLLKVIRGGGEKAGVPGAAAAHRPGVQAEIPVDIEADEPLDLDDEDAGQAVPPLRAADKPRLTLATPKPVVLIGDEPDSPDGEAAAGGVAAGLPAVSHPGAPAEGATGLPPVAAPGRGSPRALQRKPGAGVSTVDRVNRILVVIVFVILGYAAFEFWSNLSAGPARVVARPIGAPPAVRESSAPAGLPSVDVFLADLSAKPFPWIIPEEAPPPTPIPATARENLAVLAISGLPGSGVKEAIVVDKKLNKLHFVRIGQKIIVDEKELELTEIRADRCVFSDGQNTIEVR